MVSTIIKTSGQEAKEFGHLEERFNGGGSMEEGTPAVEYKEPSILWGNLVMCC